jgi:hypothetical protein
MFKVPDGWQGRRIFLVFEGVMTDASVSFNGQPAGSPHQGAYYRFKYEVTPLVKFGNQNLLEVAVNKHSQNQSVNNAERKGDFWMYGGIFRPVYLESEPSQFIDRVAVDARADGALEVDAFVNGTNFGTLEAQVMTLDGKDFGSSFNGPVAGEKTVLRATNGSPLLWTAETPNLYQVEVRLKNGEVVVHRVRQRFGFRTFEVREGDGLYLNGNRVVLKGCNRHSFWPESGRCLSPTVHRLDIETMKDMNMNAVRMSHYPPDAEFLDLCDELGLYVLDELAGWHWNYDDATGTKLVNEMVSRDVNHPSVLFWDNGNEGGFNTNLDKLFSEFDPQQRHVLHPWSLFGGVNTGHYKPYDQAKALCEGPDIYMPTEFMHGLYDGGAGAGLEDIWGLMSKSKVLGGGFIWAFLDEGVKRADTGQIDVAGNQAPDGIVGPYRQKEGSFFTIKKIWSPILVRETALGSDFSGTLTLENHFGFTDARQCSFEWQLRKFRGPGESSDGYKVLAHGLVAAPSIPPGETGALKIQLPKKWNRADALSLRASDPSGRELWTWVWPLPQFKEATFGPDASKPSRGSVTVTESGDELKVKAGNLSVTFDKKSGMLSEVQRRDQKFSLTNGPQPAGGNAQLVSLEHKNDGHDLVVQETFTGTLKSVEWRIRPDGWVQCDYTTTADGPKDFIGVSFDYPETQVRSKKWLGLGPYRVWKNRMGGGSLNVWQNEYNNTITGWADWIYPEFKGCFAGVRWLQMQTTEGPVTVVPASDDSFVQVLTPSFPPTNLVGKAGVTLPKAGMSFLNAIPPIGSKFAGANLSGPQGQLTEATGEYRGSVNFYFGKLP